jgi:hypothetical protein
MSNYPVGTAETYALKCCETPAAILNLVKVVCRASEKSTQVSRRYYINARQKTASSVLS